jgi:sporulation protein YlmC with PRC-barrel domain
MPLLRLTFDYMLHSVKSLTGFSVVTGDTHDLGYVRDVLFDENDWVVRYLVVELGGVAAGRSSVISPISVSKIDRNLRRIHLGLTAQKVKGAPEYDPKTGVSREFEISLFNYYRYAFYWTGPYLWGPSPFPIALLGTSARNGNMVGTLQVNTGHFGGPHLQSASNVNGWSIEAWGRRIGYIEDLLLHEGDWSILFIAVDALYWQPNAHIMLPPNVVEYIGPEAKINSMQPCYRNRADGMAREQFPVAMTCRQ